MKLLKVTAFLFLMQVFSLQGQLNLIVSSSTGNFSLTCSHPTILLTASGSYTGGPVTYTWTNPQLSIVNGYSIIASTQGIYSLSASSGTVSQSFTASLVIHTVQPTVTLTAASGSLTCITNSILLTASSHPTAVSYTWIEPGVGFACITPTCKAGVAGVYGVTVEDSVNGCQNTATLTISENKLFPGFNSIPLYTTACPAGTVTLDPALSSGTNNIVFHWFAPPGAILSATNGPALNTNTLGEYTLQVTNTINGCSTMTTVQVSACVGLHENQLELPVSAYPNPVSAILNLELEQLTGFTITVSNGLGEEVLRINNEKYIDFGQLTMGFYFVTIQAATGRKILKVVKQ